MVLFPKGITLIFLTTSPGKAVRSVKGSGKLSTKWLKPQMQMSRVEGLNLKHNLDFDEHLALQASSLYHQVKAQVPLSSRMGKHSFSCSTFCLQREKALEHLVQLGQWSSRTQENQVQLQWIHTKITWACNCHKTLRSNCQPNAELPKHPYPQKQIWIKEWQRGFSSLTF